MKKAEFDRIVKESVANGADAKEAAAYVVSGFKLPTDGNGKPVFETGDARQETGAKPKAPAKKKPAAKK